MESFDPKSYLTIALVTIRERPALLILKAFVDVAQGVLRFLVFLSLVVFAAVVLARSIQTYGAGFMEPVVRLASNPAVFLSVAGVLYFSWLLGFAIQSGVWAVVFDYLGEQLGQQPTKLEPLRAFQRFSRSWGRAAIQRLYTFFMDACLVGIWATTIMGTTWVTRSIERSSGSEVVLPALIWAVVLTFTATFTILIRLATLLTAAAWFTGRNSFGQALQKSFEVALRYPIQLYRLFILALSILLVPLFVYWCAVMVQNVTIEIPELAPIGSLIRLAGEAILVVGTAAFVLIFQVMMFAFYSVARGLTEDIKDFTFSARLVEQDETPPSLEELLPEDYNNVVDVKEIMKWTAEGGEDPPPAPEVAAQAPTSRLPKELPQPFDLSGLLRKPTDHAEEE